MKYRKNPLKDLAKLLSGKSSKEKIKTVKLPVNPLLKKSIRIDRSGLGPITPYHF